ncbi:MAG: mercury resistance system transport protein MerF [Pseudomonadota bacterium]
MEGHRTLIATGAVDAVLAAICCATPLLALLFGGLGLTAWLAKADYVVMPALLICLLLLGVGLYRRRPAQSSCAPSVPRKGNKS